MLASGFPFLDVFSALFRLLFEVFRTRGTKEVLGLSVKEDLFLTYNLPPPPSPYI